MGLGLARTAFLEQVSLISITMALIIAGDRSGVGKTTITLALLSYLVQQKQRVQSFKVGPDYIDPMFHSAITGRPCRNLDPVLTSEAYVQSCFDQHCQGADHAVIEGVMGLFDGIRYPSDHPPSAHLGLLDDFASTAHIARLLKLPILLVVDCSRLSASIAALVQGYRTLDPQLQIVGVILNRVGSDRHLELLQNALNSLKIDILGILRREVDLTIPDRHLGLVPSEELPQLSQLCARLAHLAQQSFHWKKLLPLLRSPSLLVSPSKSPVPLSPLRIALARDRAFNFYYADNLDHLQQLGAELIDWSPIRDRILPENIHGIYLGGGFPEVFAPELAANISAQQSLRQAIGRGLPVYAECGGLMYLCQNIVDFKAQKWKMLGIIPTDALMHSQLTLGYRQAQVLRSDALLPKNTTFWGHEFHRSYLAAPPSKAIHTLQAQGSSSQVAREGWQQDSVHATYLHTHFGGCPTLPSNFLHQCLAFSKQVR